MSGLDAAETACAVVDRADLSRLLGTGPDLLALIHRLSTGDVKDLGPGEGRPTVLTNAKGRIVERLFLHHLGSEGVLVIAGPGSAWRVLAHLRKYTFAEQAVLTDRTDATFALALLGPRWADAAETLGLAAPPPYGVSAAEVSGIPVHVVRTNGFDADGLLVTGAREGARPVLAALTAAAESAGGGAINAEDAEAWRILKGLPTSGHELTEEHNPLEAGLREAVSFTKGCYVGQEVVARLNTYDKVSRAIVRLELAPDAAVPALGAAVRRDGSAIGAVTSAIRPRNRPGAVALAYVKVRELPPGVTSVTIDDGIAGVPATILRP